MTLRYMQLMGQYWILVGKIPPTSLFVKKIRGC